MSVMEIPEELAELEPHEFEFIQFHALQLANTGIKLSKDFVKKLYAKVSKEVFDAGEVFQLMEDPNESCFRLQAINDVSAHSDVFLVDHFFSFRYRDLRNTLLNNENARKRLRNMTKFFGERKSLRDSLFRPKNEDKRLNPEFDGDKTIVDPRGLDIDWAQIETLSLCECGIVEADIIADMLTKCPNLKALWLNGCPVSEGQREKFMTVYLEEKHPHVQIYNSKLTKHAKEWAIKFCTYGLSCVLGDEIAIEQMRECDISGRNFYALKDDHSVFDRMQNVRTLKAKETFFESFGEANRFIQMIRDMKKLERLELDYYMLDLFWDIKDRIKELNPTIRYINEYDLGYDKPKPLDEEVDGIIRNMWKITHSYKVMQGDNIDLEPIFYVMDEVGSALGHSADPNVVTFPFIYFKDNKAGGQGLTYNLIYPIKDIAFGDFATRDFIVGYPEELRQIRLGIWEQVEFGGFFTKFLEHTKLMETRQKEGSQELAKLIEELKPKEKVPSSFKNAPLKVYTDSKQVKELLHDKRFELTTNIEEADILYIQESIKHYKEKFGDKLKADLLINQFPFEGRFANKRFLSETVKKK